MASVPPFPPPFPPLACSLCVCVSTSVCVGEVFNLHKVELNYSEIAPCGLARPPLQIICECVSQSDFY